MAMAIIMAMVMVMVPKPIVAFCQQCEKYSGIKKSNKKAGTKKYISFNLKENQ